MFEEDLRPRLVEVNVSPSLACDADMDYQIKSRLFSDTLHTVGVAVGSADAKKRRARPESGSPSRLPTEPSGARREAPDDDIDQADMDAGETGTPPTDAEERMSRWLTWRQVSGENETFTVKQYYWRTLERCKTRFSHALIFFWVFRLHITHIQGHGKIATSSSSSKKSTTDAVTSNECSHRYLRQRGLYYSKFRFDISPAREHSAYARTPSQQKVLISGSMPRDGFVFHLHSICAGIWQSDQRTTCSTRHWRCAKA